MEKIKNVLAYGAKPADKDYGERRIVPGFIDVHTHGAYGFDTNDAVEEGLRNWMKHIPEEVLPESVLPQSHRQRRYLPRQ